MIEDTASCWTLVKDAQWVGDASEAWEHDGRAHIMPQSLADAIRAQAVEDFEKKRKTEFTQRMVENLREALDFTFEEGLYEGPLYELLIKICHMVVADVALKEQRKWEFVNAD